MLTPAQAWDRLYQGFKRGAKTPSEETLEQIASNMHRSHAYQRVYWAGAAYWLTVDRDLRRASGDAMNLETALARFRDCCLPAYREWKPEDFVARLDALRGSDVFAARYPRVRAMRQFPDWEKTILGPRHPRRAAKRWPSPPDAKMPRFATRSWRREDVGSRAAAAGR
jgi:predicted metalloprotease with PDZ domain